MALDDTSWKYIWIVAHIIHWIRCFILMFFYIELELKNDAKPKTTAISCDFAYFQTQPLLLTHSIEPSQMKLASLFEIANGQLISTFLLSKHQQIDVKCNTYKSEHWRTHLLGKTTIKNKHHSLILLAHWIKRKRKRLTHAIVALIKIAHQKCRKWNDVHLEVVKIFKINK